MCFQFATITNILWYFRSLRLKIRVTSYSESTFTPRLCSFLLNLVCNVQFMGTYVLYDNLPSFLLNIFVTRNFKPFCRTNGKPQEMSKSQSIG